MATKLRATSLMLMLAVACMNGVASAQEHAAAVPATRAAALPDIAVDWAEKAGAALPDAAAIRIAVQDVRQAEAAAVNPRRYENDTLRADRYEIFAAEFAEARVPDCLHPDALKRQSTLIFSGLLKLPFVALAKLRGKCN